MKKEGKTRNKNENKPSPMFMILTCSIDHEPSVYKVKKIVLVITMDFTQLS